MRWFFVVKNRRKMMRLGIIFCVWLIIIFTAGNMISNKMKENNKKVKIEQTVAIENIPEEKRTEEQKETLEKIHKLSQKAVTSDVKGLENILKLNKGWSHENPVLDKDIPILNVYFPGNQSRKAWREALVFRAFYGVKVKAPENLVMDIYETWLKQESPDVMLKKTNTKEGILFSGYSGKYKIFLCGKVITGSLDGTVFIIQYTIKNNGAKDFETKSVQWEQVMEQIK